MMIANATDFQNNFGRYLQAVQNGEEIIILKNGKETARLISHEKSVEFLSQQLKGILKNDCDEKAVREERLKKYEDPDRYKCDT
ncbi:MAG: type II toxin-antitoxin system Phd/YefM family antitoxin [Ruminococcus sp.]|nr:type II toxin-antitoxin system Phd/YefM family antitoxin [Ruminococcus sp.]